MSSTSVPSGNDLNGRAPPVKFMLEGPGQYHLAVLDETQRKGLHVITFEAPERKIMRTCGMQSNGPPSNNETTETAVAIHRLNDWDTNRCYELHFLTPGRYELYLYFNPFQGENEAKNE